MLATCRLCAQLIQDEATSVWIFGKNGDETKLPEILTRHYGIEIHAEDTCRQICSKCWHITNEFHGLYEIVQSSEIQLFSYSFEEQPSACGDETDCEPNNDEFEPPAMHINDISDKKPTPNMSEEIDAAQSEIDCNADISAVKVEPTDQDVKPNMETADGENGSQLVSPPLKRRKPGRPPGSLTKSSEESAPKRSKNIRDESKIEKEDKQIRDFFRMSCDLCKLKFQTMREAMRHYRISHQQAGYLVCCEKKFFRRCIALDHIRLHLNPKFLQCDKCDKTYTTKFALYNHQMGHDPAPVKPYTCEVCAMGFAKRFQLTQHMRVRHIDRSNKPFGCDICGKFFVTKYVLTSHMKGVHENANARMCHICAKTFKSKKVHDLHQLEHLEHEPPKLQCNICGSWLKHEDSLRKHIARHAETETLCKLCNKMYPSKTALGNHMRYVHSERSHRCTLCDKAFKKPVGLKEHMALHTGIDLYTCPYCPRTFKSGANMHSHRKKEHFDMWAQDRHNRLSSNVVIQQPPTVGE